MLSIYLLTDFYGMTLSKSINTTAINTGLIWGKNGTPVSKYFDDVYFSNVSGMAETHHVFLKGNSLEQRFSALEPSSCFVITETGFGTGLNFLCTWHLFNQTAPHDCQLHYISTEKYPLSTEEIEQALAVFPALKEYIAELCQHYPQSRATPRATPIELNLAKGRIKLTLLIGDVLDTLPTLTEKTDAWFLDGFAPSKNPDMWQHSLFTAMAEHSKQNTTYATFTAASVVRRGLHHCGFSVIKSPGYGKKRDMLHGQFMPERNGQTNQQPWYAPSAHRNPERSAIIIGGGLAGTSCARALAEKGWQVNIIEQHHQLATEASGNPQGVLYAKLSADNTPLSRFILQGYHYSLALLNRLNLKDWQPCGVIQLSTNNKLTDRYKALDQQHPDSLLQYLNKHQLTDIAGLPIEYDGLFYPQAGWVNPPSLCKALAEHPNIQVTLHTPISEIKKENNDWLLFSEGKQIAKTRTLVIAEGTNSQHLSQLQHLPLKAIRGQITQVAATETSQKLTSCVCGEGYIAPAVNGQHTMGATFNFKDNNPQVTDKDHQKNLGMQSFWFQSMHQALGGTDAEIIGGRVGFRCTTPDYLPMVGAIVDYQRFIDQYAPLRKNMKHRFSDRVSYLEGLYVTTGHGSRGTLSCPLSGEILACMIHGDPSPLEENLHHHVNPTRFLVRALARDQI